MHWIVQQTKTQTDNDVYQRLLYTLEEMGVPYTSFVYIPFEGTDYSFMEGVKSPAVFFGTFNALNDMRKRVPNLPEPFAWYETDAFECISYYELLKGNLLQEDHVFMRLGDVLGNIDSLYSRFGRKVFLRPNDNEKSFVGSLVKIDLLESWVKGVSNNNSADLLVVASSPKEIEYEWRFVVVWGQIVAGSQYKAGDCIDIHHEYPTAAAVFAKKMAWKWYKFPVFIVDVCLTGGEYKVVEVGPFNYAGLYRCDLRAIVKAINNIYSDF